MHITNIMNLIKTDQSIWITGWIIHNTLMQSQILRSHSNWNMPTMAQVRISVMETCTAGAVIRTVIASNHWI